MLELRSEALRAGQFAPDHRREIPHVRWRQHRGVRAGRGAGRHPGARVRRARPGRAPGNRAGAARHPRLRRGWRPAGDHAVRRRTIRRNSRRAPFPHRAFRREHHPGAPAGPVRRRGGPRRARPRARCCDLHGAEQRGRTPLAHRLSHHGAGAVRHRGAAGAPAAAPGTLCAHRLRRADLLRLHQPGDRRAAGAGARRDPAVVRPVVGARGGRAAGPGHPARCRAGTRGALSAQHAQPARRGGRHEPARSLRHPRRAGRRVRRARGAGRAGRAVPVRQPAGRHRRRHLHRARRLLVRAAQPAAAGIRTHAHRAC